MHSNNQTSYGGQSVPPEVHAQLLSNTIAEAMASSSGRQIRRFAKEMTTKIQLRKGEEACVKLLSGDDAALYISAKHAFLGPKHEEGVLDEHCSEATGAFCQRLGEVNPEVIKTQFSTLAAAIQVGRTDLINVKSVRNLQSNF